MALGPYDCTQLQVHWVTFVSPSSVCRGVFSDLIHSNQMHKVPVFWVGREILEIQGQWSNVSQPVG